MDQRVLLDFRLSKVGVFVTVLSIFIYIPSILYTSMFHCNWCCKLFRIFASTCVAEAFYLAVNLLFLCFQGDGLEFKRLFIKIKQKLGDIISTQKIT